MPRPKLQSLVADKRSSNGILIKLNHITCLHATFLNDLAVNLNLHNTRYKSTVFILLFTVQHLVQPIHREGKGIVMACLILLSYIPIIASHNNLLSFPNLSKIIFSLWKIDYIQLTILALYHSHHVNPFWIQRFYTFVHDLDLAFNKTKNRQRLVPKSYPWIDTRSILAYLTVTRGTVCWKKNREKK